jgi:hypothetical protein
VQSYSWDFKGREAPLCDGGFAGILSLLHGGQFGVASRPGSLNFRSVIITQLKPLSIAPQPSIVATLPITTRSPGVFFQPFFDYRDRQDLLQEPAGQRTAKSAHTFPIAGSCTKHARPSPQFSWLCSERSRTNDAMSVGRTGIGVTHS